MYGTKQNTIHICLQLVALFLVKLEGPWNRQAWRVPSKRSIAVVSVYLHHETDGNDNLIKNSK